MKQLNKKASQIFNQLVRIMDDQDHVKIDKTNETFMPVVLERLAETEIHGHKVDVFSLAHYFEQNGDLVPDPDMVFFRFVDYPEKILPGTFQNQMSYKEAIWLDGDRWKYNPKEQADQVSFANMWLKNIKHQQDV